MRDLDLDRLNVWLPRKTRQKLLDLVLNYEQKIIIFSPKFVCFFKKFLGMGTLVGPGDDQVKY
jgi:hypothetical protein